MIRRIHFMLAAGAVMAMPAQAGNPKLAKCTGPTRYANPYGTVLPSLPIPGEPAHATTTPSPTPASAPPVPETPPAGGVALPTPPAGAPKTGALLPYYPSC